MDAKDEQPKKSKRLDSLAKRKQRNPKAFAINAPRAAERRYRRKQDIEEKKFHVPLADRTPLEPPPVIVAVVGPPKVGKSTLIKSLVKYYTKHTLNVVNGPVTLVSGKKRRITLIECNNDIHSMIDIAKIADLVLLLVDASFGFEMELFEFLNLCQAHGFPKIMAILTHLDLLKNEAEKKKVKKEMKKRFWTEIYKGAKLFFVSGVMNNLYGKRDTQNIARQVSVMKFRPLSWQTSHSYMLVDRIEDLSDAEKVRRNKDCDRKISLYGYIRGTPLLSNSDIHIPGCGDFKINALARLPDPCPLPMKGERQKGSMNQRDRLIYAPFCGVGGVVCDKDAVYIEVAGAHSFSEKIAVQDSDKLVSKIMRTTETIDDKMKTSNFQFYTDRAAQDMNHQGEFDVDKISDEGDGHYDDEDDEDDEDDNDDDDDESFEDEEENYDDEDDDAGINFSWKDKLGKKAESSFFKRQLEDKDIQRLVYGGVNGFVNIYAGLSNPLNSDINDKIMQPTENSIECTSDQGKSLNLEKNYEKFLHSIKNKFVTGKWSSEENAFGSDGSDFGQEDDSNISELGSVGDDDATNEDKIIFDEGENCDDIFDDFEDLESGKKFTKAAVESKFELNRDNVNKGEEDDEDKLRMLAKIRKKSEFDSHYDAGDVDLEAPPEKTFYATEKEKLQKQADTNKEFLQGLNEDIRIQIEGYRAGLYAKIELNNVPAPLVDNFDPSFPLIVGGLNPGELGEGYVRVRIKKHRWYKKILKTRDPLIISLGWRRFQTLPVYHLLDDNMRNRALKYTPWHLHCLATFWAPFSPQGTGLIAFQQTHEHTKDFRVAATGVTLDLNKTTDIVKKLKLVGSPMEVFTKTAFIRGMFNSALEVSKFEGATLRTVSGIRGIIKKSIRSPPGAFRATFEDKILMSDIVFLRTWYKVDVPKNLIPIRTLLMSPDERAKWRGARTIGQIRFDEGIKSSNSTNPDSIYKPVERKKFKFRPFTIPKNLQKELPYKSKPKFLKKSEDKIKHYTPIRTEAEQNRIEAISRLKAK